MFVLQLVVFIKNINTIPSGIFHLFVGLAYKKVKAMVRLKAHFVFVCFILYFQLAFCLFVP